MALSPVVEGFLAGQKQQGEIQNNLLQAKQQQQEYQLKKQHLDELVKQFQANHELSVRQFESENAYRQAHMEQAAKEFELQLPGLVHSGILPVPQQAGSPTVPTQSMETPGMSIPGLPSLPTQQNIPVGAPMSVNVRGQNYTFPRPQTAGESAVIQQQALMPGMKELEDFKAKTEADAYIKKMMPELTRKLESQEKVNQLKLSTQEAIHAAHEETLKQGFESRLSVADIAANARMMNMMMMNGIEPTKEGFANQVNQATLRVMKGEADPKDFGPIVGRAVERQMGVVGASNVPKSFNDKIYPQANNAVDFLNNVDNLKSSVNIPTSIGQRVRNAASEVTGIEGLSTYKSLFDMFRSSELPKLDLAVGLTPGTLARSPKLVNLFKALYPLPGDQPDTVAKKKVFGADIFLGGAQRQLSSLPTEQRKIYWKEIIERNPDLMKIGSIAGALSKAVESGNYTPGSGYKMALEAAQGK